MRPATILLAALAIVFTAQMASADDDRRKLTLTGTGEVSAAPDIATIDLGVVSDGKTARAALDANTAAMKVVMDVIEGLDIAAKDVQTSGFSVQPRYFHDPKQRAAPKVVGYQVNNTVHVTVRALSGLGRVLDQVVTGGSNTINRLAFSFSKPEQLMDEARKKAGADARRKAALYAEGLGIELGPIIEVHEAGGGPQPRPMRMRAAAMEASDVPISAGEQAVSSSLNVTWEID